MNVVETCKCGGSVRVVGSPAQAALQVASFRDAHKVCREPKFEVATVPASTETGTIVASSKWRCIGNGPIYVAPIEDEEQP